MTNSKSAINRNKDYNEIIEILYGADKAFKTIAEVLCFASFVGLHNGQKKSIPANKKGEPVQFRIFSGSEQLDRHIWSLCLFDKKDIVALKDHDQCLTDFEEYANGGLGVIAEKLSAHPEDPFGIDTLYAMLLKVYATYNEPTSKPKKRNIKF